MANISKVVYNELQIKFHTYCKGVNFMTKDTFIIENSTGIHARPASEFVKTAGKFKSKIELTAKGRTIDAKSIIMVMGLGLTKDTEVVITADGADEKTAVKELVALAHSFKTAEDKKKE